MNTKILNLDRHDEMVEKLSQLKEEYFKRPDITAVSVSVKMVSNKLTDTLSFTFGVKKKLPLEQVENPVPALLHGFSTDVIEFEGLHYKSEPTLSQLGTTRTDVTNPLLGGIDISSVSPLMLNGKEVLSDGTLGVMMNMGTTPCMLTCAHVLAGTGTQLGTVVSQPSKWLNTPYVAHPCATLTGYYYQNIAVKRGNLNYTVWLDAAIAQSDLTRNATIGAIYGVNNPLQGYATIDATLLKENVSKSGVYSGITAGNIMSISFHAKITNFDGTVGDAYNLILVTAGSAPFSIPGDSGAVAFITNNSLMVGLVNGGFQNAAGNNFSAIVPVDAITTMWQSLALV